LFLLSQNFLPDAVENFERRFAFLLARPLIYLEHKNYKKTIFCGYFK